MTPLFLLSALASTAAAATVTYDFNIGWINASPDGFTRPVIAVNGQFPPPVVEATVGDTVVVNVKNNLGNETTGIHWHGMFQNGTNAADGTHMTSECGIAPGASYTYTFTAYPAGSSWYHSHDQGQYPDGLRGAMVIHDTEATAVAYDEEYVMTVSDWFHDQMPYLLHQYLSPDNTGNTEPLPDSSLINDSTTATYNLEPNKKYLFRIINIGAASPFYVGFEDHDMTVVGVDNVKTNALAAQTLFIAPGQRYDVVITGISNPQKSYSILVRIFSGMFQGAPGGWNKQTNAVLAYPSNSNNKRDSNYGPGNNNNNNNNGGGNSITGGSWGRKNFPDPSPMQTFTPQQSHSQTQPGDSLQFFDDMTLTPLDNEPMLQNPDQTINLEVKFTKTNVGWRSQIGSQPFVSQKVPSMFTAMTSGNKSTDGTIYGPNSNSYVLGYNNVVQVVLNNPDSAGHPFHMHGHAYQVVARGQGSWDGSSGLDTTPVKRDTAAVYPGGYLVLRFRADNPGVWLFHCHIEFHVEGGMMITLVEAPEQLQQRESIPQSAIDGCKAQGYGTSGNCAGNTQNLDDTSQCNNSPKSNPYG